MRKEKLELINKYIEELKIIKKEVIENPTKHFLTSASYEFYLNNGRRIPREQILKNGIDGSAVFIAPRLRSGEFLVVIEPRVFTKSGIGVSFPAGYIEDGEKIEDAALRELREETGFNCRKLIHLDSFYQDEGISSAYNHSFLALNAYKEYEQDLDENEIVRYMSLTLDEIEDLEKMGLINGVITKLTLSRIKDYMKGR